VAAIKRATADTANLYAMSPDEPNLPLHANPCCGYVTDSSADTESFEQEAPDVGDLSVCLNCGALLVYTDPKRNVMRYASRLEAVTLPREFKRKIARMQQYVRKRGIIPRERQRIAGN
jgi:hypothetical protein